VARVGAEGGAVREVEPQEARELERSGAVLLDVREPREFEEGHAPFARTLPLMDLTDLVETLPRDQLIVCVCRTGRRSLVAARFLEEQGFDAANLAGGMVAWNEGGLPLEADSDGVEPTII
jgi:rhodanese-related sulfurtransferase